MKKYLFAALALTALVACSKDPVDEVLTSSEKSVFISIANMASDTRATTPGGKTTPVSDATKASTSIEDIHILFADAAGKILVVESDLTQDELQFNNIPAQVTQVAAVGNIANAPAINENLSQYKTAWQTEDVDAEYKDIVVYSDGVTLQPTAETVTVDGTQYPKYTATVEIVPYLARIEVGQIQCTDFGEVNSGYDAIGVVSMSLAGGNIIDSNPAAPSPNAAYTHTLGSFSDDDTLMAGDNEDWVMKPTSAVLTAGTGKVWSWNIAPQATSNLTTSLYVSGNGYTTSVPVRELVINKYKTGGVAFDEFKGGSVYQFDINFSHSNMQGVSDYLVADVTVIIQDWKIVDTDVDFQTGPNN